MTAAAWGKSRKDRAWSKAVLDLYGRVCMLQLDGCTGLATTADHVIPKSVRPDLKHQVANGRPACRPCNSKRGTRPAVVVPPTVDERAFFESQPCVFEDSHLREARRAPIVPPSHPEKHRCNLDGSGS